MFKWLRKKNSSSKSQKTFSIPRKKILIVEDNKLRIKLFTDLLEAHDYEVQNLNRGTNVVSRAIGFAPDLILMDIDLLDVSGIDVLGWMKDDIVLKSIPVIAVTTFAEPVDVKRIWKAGFKAYIQKPITVRTFLETIRQLLAGEVVTEPHHRPKPKSRPKRVKTSKLSGIKGFRLNNEQLELVGKLYLEGKNAQAISDITGYLSRNGIIGEIHRMGLNGRRRPKRPDKNG